MACLILSLTALLVMRSLYEMPSSFLKHLVSVACNFFRMSAINVQLSQAYNCTEITRERIRLIFELRRICLSLQMVFSLASAAVVCVQYFRLGTLICDDCAQILEAVNLVQFFTVDSMSMLIFAAILQLLRPLPARLGGYQYWLPVGQSAFQGHLRLCGCTVLRSTLSASLECRWFR